MNPLDFIKFMEKNLPYINLIFIAILSQIMNIMMNRTRKDMLELLNLVDRLSGNQKRIAESVSRIIKAIEKTEED